MVTRKDGKLGLAQSTTLIIGGMFGSAIFSLSGITISEAGPAALISWFVAGIIFLGYGLMNAELATVLPKSGGVFMFPAHVLGKTRREGRFWGWVASWAYLSGTWVGTAFAATYIGNYLSVAFPALSGYQVPLALLAVALCGVLNVFRITLAGRASMILTGSLILIMMVFVGVGLFSGRWDADHLSPFFTQGKQGATGFISAVPVAMVAYGSIVAGAFMVGEIRNPGKNVPRAMMLAMGTVMTLYVLIILTTLGLVSVSQLQGDSGMAMLPLYAAAYTRLAHLPWLPALLSIAATLALFSNMMVLSALASRAVQAAALSGILLRGLGQVNPKTGAPLRATLTVTVLFGLLAAFPSLTGLIINLGAMCNVIVISVICVTVLQSRRKFPDAARFRTPGGRLTPLVILLILLAGYVAQIFWGGWRIWLFTAGYMLVGLMIYWLGSGRSKKDPEEVTAQAGSSNQ